MRGFKVAAATGFGVAAAALATVGAGSALAAAPTGQIALPTFGGSTVRTLVQCW
jgi:hypothetical protein